MIGNLDPDKPCAPRFLLLPDVCKRGGDFRHNRPSQASLILSGLSPKASRLLRGVDLYGKLEWPDEERNGITGDRGNMTDWLTDHGFTAGPIFVVANDKADIPEAPGNGSRLQMRPQECWPSSDGLEFPNNRCHILPSRCSRVSEAHVAGFGGSRQRTSPARWFICKDIAVPHIAQENFGGTLRQTVALGIRPAT
jgi:hypothetical protein